VLFRSIVVHSAEQPQKLIFETFLYISVAGSVECTPSVVETAALDVRRVWCCC